MRHSEADKAQALDTLRRSYPEGSRVFTILRSVSRTAMSRKVSTLAVTVGAGGEVDTWWTSWAVSVLTDYPYAEAEGGVPCLRMGGVGYSHGEALADAIERALGYPPNTLKHTSL